MPSKCWVPFPCEFWQHKAALRSRPGVGDQAQCLSEGSTPFSPPVSDSSSGVSEEAAGNSLEEEDSGSECRPLPGPQTPPPAPAEC